MRSRSDVPALVTDCCLEHFECGELFDHYVEHRDRQTRNQLVMSHEWLARRSARGFAGRGQSVDDLTQVGCIGLIKAIDRFDPERGIGFAAYATPTVVGEVKRHFRDKSWELAVPRRAKDNRTAVLASMERLQQQLGRSPTPDEVAAHLDVDRDIVIETLMVNRAYRSAPLDAAVDPDRAKFLADPDGGATSRVENRLVAFEAINQLSERDRKILYWRFFEECSQREIGERLGVGQVQVSRLLAALMVKLRRHVTVPAA